MKDYPWRKATGLTARQIKEAKHLTDTVLGEAQGK